jgi:hypothetical protein
MEVVVAWMQGRCMNVWLERVCDAAMDAVCAGLCGKWQEAVLSAVGGSRCWL